MSNFTEYIRVRNFKSIKKVDLVDCRRVNLFIGKPNVGKSNLLEAISLFGLPYLKYAKKKNLRQFIRVENDSELFFDGNMDEKVRVDSSFGEVEIRTDPKGIIIDVTVSANPSWAIPQSLTFTNLVCTKKNIDDSEANPFRSYYFPSEFDKEKNSLNHLQPPHGNNLMNIVSQLPKLKNELRDIFAGYNLRYVFDTNSQEIKIIKEKNSGDIFLIPFHSIADTLQRMIFYKAAIESNTDAIITFEEPEAHSYPPYISKITQSIIASKENQFFITTHSPYVVTDFLEALTGELAIYLIDFKKGETVVKRLSDKELNEIYEYGIDLFFNTETFLK